MYPYYNPESKQAVRMMESAKTARQPDKRLLKLLGQALYAESQDAAYYKQLMDIMPDEEDAALLKGIYLEECKHKKMLGDLYYQLAGCPVTLPAIGQESPSAPPMSEYKKCLFNEWDAIDFYRKIMFALESQSLRDLMFEIITDEQIHAQKLMYLLTKCAARLPC